MDLSTAAELRARLATSLEKLSKLRSIDLVREDALGPKLNFRSGIPVFEKTLSFYRQVAAADLSRTPSPILAIALDRVSESLSQFEAIETFDPAGIDRPEQLRNLLINEIATSHAACYEDLCILLAPSRAQMQKPTSGPRPVFAVTLVVLIAAAAFMEYRYSTLSGFVRQLESSAHSFLGPQH